jgi:Tfp pilus assembly protein PilP
VIKLFLFLFLFNQAFAEEGKTEVNPNPNAAATSPPTTPATAPVTAVPLEENQVTAPINESKNDFEYNENEGRDPFKRYRDPSLILQSKQDPKKEEIDLALLKIRNIKTILVPVDVILLGIVYNKDNPVAAIKVKEGKTYYMKKNDQIGRNEGKIVDITSNSVLIEQFRNFDGQKILEKVVLKFKKNEQN